MSKSQLIITVSIIFLLLGTISLAGATPAKGIYDYPVTGLSASDKGLMVFVNGNDMNGSPIGWTYIQPSDYAVSVYDTFVAAYTQHQTILTYIGDNGYITGGEVVSQ